MSQPLSPSRLSYDRDFLLKYAARIKPEPTIAEKLLPFVASPRQSKRLATQRSPYGKKNSDLDLPKRLTKTPNPTRRAGGAMSNLSSNPHTSEKIGGLRQTLGETPSSPKFGTQTNPPYFSQKENFPEIPNFNGYMQHVTPKQGLKSMPKFITTSLDSLVSPPRKAGLSPLPPRNALHTLVSPPAKKTAARSIFPKENFGKSDTLISSSGTGDSNNLYPVLNPQTVCSDFAPTVTAVTGGYDATVPIPVPVSAPTVPLVHVPPPPEIPLPLPFPEEKISVGIITPTPPPVEPQTSAPLPLPVIPLTPIMSPMKPYQPPHTLTPSRITDGSYLTPSKQTPIKPSSFSPFRSPKSPKSPKSPNRPISPLDEQRLIQRQKQIDYGYRTVGYLRYRLLVTKDQRKPEHPRTPKKTQGCSKRSWDGQLKKWRRDLHLWDPDNLEAFKALLSSDLVVSMILANPELGEIIKIVKEKMENPNFGLGEDDEGIPESPCPSGPPESVRDQQSLISPEKTVPSGVDSQTLSPPKTNDKRPPKVARTLVF